ncbi:MAG TPA: hypothetical protein VES73_03245 [Lamprocystis sp. (in: g-proteobacteria)]|nr:hypothetical protein [Lamprocystis sp. (in: g-proteobacteria)]
MRKLSPEFAILLIGGDLHRGPDLTENCRDFLAAVTAAAGGNQP